MLLRGLGTNMPIKSYKGTIADGGQDELSLRTIRGMVGYRVVKFDIFPTLPGTESVESTVAIWTKEQSSVSTTTATIDFTDGNLVAVAMYHDSSSEATTAQTKIVFDNQVFNQNIFVTHTDTNSNIPINYYIELETIPLTENQQSQITLASLKEIYEAGT